MHSTVATPTALPPLVLVMPVSRGVARSPPKCWPFLCRNADDIEKIQPF
jgi:hypothetical protein